LSTGLSSSSSSYSMMDSVEYSGNVPATGRADTGGISWDPPPAAAGHGVWAIAQDGCRYGTPACGSGSSHCSDTMGNHPCQSALIPRVCPPFPGSLPEGPFLMEDPSPAQAIPLCRRCLWRYRALALSAPPRMAQVRTYSLRTIRTRTPWRQCGESDCPPACTKAWGDADTWPILLLSRPAGVVERGARLVQGVKHQALQNPVVPVWDKCRL
jgi:hypothetical protein